MKIFTSELKLRNCRSRVEGVSYGSVGKRRTGRYRDGGTEGAGGSCEDTDQPCAAKKHSGRRDGESKVGQNRKCIRCYFGDRLFVAEGNAGSMACR